MAKYKNIITEIDNIKFHSKAEANRYQYLKHLLKAGEISNLELQPRYDYKINGKFIFFYKADFRYILVCNNETIIEDVKSEFTAKLAIFKLKQKLIESHHNIKITLVK